jgi:hypothetical protein
MSRNRSMRRNLSIVIFGVIACMLIINGYTSSKGKKIQFETVEIQDSTGTGQNYLDKDIHLVVIPSIDGVGAVDSWVSEGAQNELMELDYSKFFALAVFQGIKPTNRYSIEITKVTRTDNTINLETNVHNRDPNLEAADVETSPYHLISIIKAGNWSEDFTFTVIQNGTIITSTKHFIP